MDITSRHGVLGALWLAVVLPAVWLPMDAPADEVLGKAAPAGPAVVVYSSDAGGFAALLHSMVSLARHLEDPRQCVIHLIVPREHLPSARRLLDCWRRELGPSRVPPEVALHELRPPGLLNVSGLWRQKERSDSSVAANLARNYLPEYLPDTPRVLWLDIDTIVQADVAALFRTPMRHGIAAVLETQVGVFILHDVVPPRLRRLFEYELAGWSYFNPGVLLIDLERWRAENTSGKVESRVQHLRGWLIDTLALNWVFVDKVDLLGLDWNFQGLNTDTNWSEFELSVRRAKILHWHGGWKPWHEDKPKKFGVNDHLYRAYDCSQPCDDLC